MPLIHVTLQCTSYAENLVRAYTRNTGDGCIACLGTQIYQLCGDLSWTEIHILVAKARHGTCVVEVGQAGLIHLGSEIQHTNKYGPQCMHESESEPVDSRGNIQLLHTQADFDGAMSCRQQAWQSNSAANMHFDQITKAVCPAESYTSGISIECLNFAPL